jgi:hypothetical protein
MDGPAADEMTKSLLGFLGSWKSLRLELHIDLAPYLVEPELETDGVIDGTVGYTSLDWTS